MALDNLDAAATKTHLRSFGTPQTQATQFMVDGGDTERKPPNRAATRGDPPSMFSKDQVAIGHAQGRSRESHVRSREKSTSASPLARHLIQKRDLIFR